MSKSVMVVVHVPKCRMLVEVTARNEMIIRKIELGGEEDVRG